MDWPHSPPHKFSAGTFFITAGTLHKHHLFRSEAALDELLESLFASATEERCSLEAWCLLSNYHLVVQTEAGENLHRMLRRFHSTSAKAINARDGTRGRQVWYQFRDTELTFERSWLARLRYTNENAVHHGVVRLATQYRWRSASWFEEHARAAFVATLRSVRMDLVKIVDEFEAAPLPFESGGRAAALH
jgi:putative transposase